MQNSQAVYQRMQTERQREAAEFRAQGSERSQEIRARADRDVTVLVADATQRGEQARGDGDADRARILPVHACLRGRVTARQHAAGVAAGLPFLSVLRRPVASSALEITTGADNRRRLPPTVDRPAMRGFDMG